ncbi:MAG TPA: DUF4159 domain-containing protein [Hyphomicrobiales bacterium]|nr:DUF4159 domain-containing protein [Hyphomicrobiales bacterium]
MSVFRLLLLLGCLLGTDLLQAQSEWREYPSIERGRYRREPPAQQQPEPAEFVVGRLMFPQYDRGPFGSGRGDWRQGGTAWTVDYPDGDRTFARLLGRLTTLDVRAVEQAVNLDEDSAFDWPFLISGLVGSWNLTDYQALRLREYLLKGGFLLCDSFYGQAEWDGFIATLRRVFPDRLVVDLPDDHPIFHHPYDLSDKRQIPTWQYLPQGYRDGGVTPHWRGVLDDDGRVMVMITYNNDVADGWQRADDPGYPQYEANLAIRLGVNFALYALTH